MDIFEPVCDTVIVAFAAWRDVRATTALCDQSDYGPAKELLVHVTGPAMLDTQHFGDKHPIRRTHWEIHPVKQLEVRTTTKSQYDAGTGWTPLEDMP